MTRDALVVFHWRRVRGGVWSSPVSLLHCRFARLRNSFHRTR